MGEDTAVRKRPPPSKQRFKSESTKQLESIVFGYGFGVADGSSADKVRDSSPLGDSVGANLDADAEEPATPAKKRRKRKASKAKAKITKGGDEEQEAKCAWVDADDATLQVDLTARKITQKLRRDYVEEQVTGDEYERRLRAQFVKLHGASRWAEEPAVGIGAARDSSDDEGERHVPTSAKGVLAPQPGGRVKPDEIEIETLKDLPMDGDKGPATIQALQFHPKEELLLTGGMDKTLRLHAVDGDENPKVSSHFFKDFAIMNAKFTPSGDQILMTGLDHRMFGLDVKTGQSFRMRSMGCSVKRFFGPYMGPGEADGDAGRRSSQLYALLADVGSVLVNDLRTKMPVRTLRMSSLGAAAVFSADKEVLYTADQQAHIYEWDLGTGRCKYRTQDSHSQRVTSLALSRSTPRAPNPMLAVGTLSGNIDLFDAGGPKLSDVPVHSIGNLTTRISGVHFHHQSELLVGFSQFQKGALRLVHNPTWTVYRQWPPRNAPIGTVSAFAFARENGLMAVGNEKGRVLLWRIRQYQNSLS